MTVKNIFDFLNSKFPVETACDFDNVGILVGNRNDEVTSAVIALDCTESAIKTAIENGSQLIITHHPVLFDAAKRFTEDSIVYKLIKNGISVISMHTNLDIGKDGVNDTLCKTLGFQNFGKFTCADGLVLNTASLSFPVSAEELALGIKNALNVRVRFSATNKKIKNILICSGGGAGYFAEAALGGFDALISGDVKLSVFSDAERLGIAVFDAGHFDTEDIIIEPLKELLESEFRDIKFITNHTSLIKTV